METVGSAGCWVEKIHPAGALVNFPKEGVSFLMARRFSHSLPQTTIILSGSKVRSGGLLLESGKATLPANWRNASNARGESVP